MDLQPLGKDLFSKWRSGKTHLESINFLFLNLQTSASIFPSACIRGTEATAAKGKTITPNPIPIGFKYLLNTNDFFVLTFLFAATNLGAPQWGQDGALSEIYLPHS